MRLSEVWVVRDPTDNSELIDIVFSTSPEEIAGYVIGTGYQQWRVENHTFYTTEAEAIADAQNRLKNRGNVK